MTDWPRPEPFRGVIFDVHSTLIDQGSADEWLDIALTVAPHPLDAHDRAALVAFLDRIWEGARISDPDSSRDLSFEAHSRVFHELIAGGPGVDRALANALYDVMLDTWHAYDDTVPTLRALKEAGISICLLSNAGVPIRSVLDREGVTPLVDAVVLSYEVGCVKPDHRIFRAALAALRLDASSVLMVGDNANDDGGGAALGLRTLILPRTTGRVHGLDVVTTLVLAGGASSGA
jgi:HAD superfamily hydrolase (TIGR01549 family)